MEVDSCPVESRLPCGRVGARHNRLLCHAVVRRVKAERGRSPGRVRTGNEDPRQMRSVCPSCGRSGSYPSPTTRPYWPFGTDARAADTSANSTNAARASPKNRATAYQNAAMPITTESMPIAQAPEGKKPNQMMDACQAPSTAISGQAGDRVGRTVTRNATMLATTASATARIGAAINRPRVVHPLEPPNIPYPRRTQAGRMRAAMNCHEPNALRARMRSGYAPALGVCSAVKGNP